MGNLCCKANKDPEESRPRGNAPGNTSNHSPLFKHLAADPQRPRSISEGKVEEHFTWEKTPLSGSECSYYGKDIRTGKPVVVSRIPVTNDFTASQRNALYEMAKYPARVCRNTGAVKTAQVDRAFFYGDTLTLVSLIQDGPCIPDAVVAAGSKFDEATALFWLADLAEGLQDLHKRGFVQGQMDIMALRVIGMKKTGASEGAKEAFEAGNVQIPTFNLCALSPNTRSLPVWAGALAPEVLLGEDIRPTAATDVWDLGVVLHMLLVGEPPMNEDAEETKKIVAKRRAENDSMINTADFGGWDRIGEATKDLVVDMLRLDPTKRLNAEQVYNEDRKSVV